MRRKNNLTNAEDQIRQEADSNPNRSLQEKLIEHCTSERFEYYLSQSNEPYVTFQDKPTIGISLKSQAFNDFLKSVCWSLYGSGVSDGQIRQVVNALVGKCLSEKNVRTLYNRFGRKGNIVVCDLGDDKNVVTIDSSGWQTIQNSPLQFRRFSHQQVQSRPSQDGDLDRILDYVNLSSSDDRLLFLTYLVTACLCDIPRPVLLVSGDRGSAKSTLMRITRSILDPSYSDLLHLNAKADDLFLQADHNYCLYFDNISGLSGEISDTFCKLSTGIAMSKRMLYTNQEEVVFALKSLVGLSSIHLVANKPDLLDRSLILNLSRISDELRTDEGTLFSRFNADKQYILGGLFKALSSTLAVAATLKLKASFRMADYALFASAAAVALGFSAEDFMRAYQHNIVRQNQIALDHSPIAQVLIKFMQGQKNWEGSSTDLFEQLQKFVKENTSLSYFDLKDVRWLWRLIKEVRVNLQAIGLEVEHKEINSGSFIKIHVTDKFVATHAT